jgi:hypothetical protein
LSIIRPSPASARHCFVFPVGSSTIAPKQASHQPCEGCCFDRRQTSQTMAAALYDECQLFDVVLHEHCSSGLSMPVLPSSTGIALPQAPRWIDAAASFRPRLLLFVCVQKQLQTTRGK